MSLVALVILSLVEPVAAADLPKVAVVGVHQAELDAEDQARAIAALVRALEANGQVNAIAGDDVAVAIRGREAVILADGLLGPGRRLLADGRNLYNQAQAEDAVAVLEQAVATLRLGQAAANNTKDLWEAWVYLGTSLQALERHEEADAAFRSAVALNPGRAPNPGIFPPPVVEAYTAAQAALGERTVTLRVEADAGATVYVDGENRGKGTVELSGVYPGEHHVLALAKGVQAYQRLVVDAPVVEGEPPADGSGAATRAADQVVPVTLALGQPSLGSPADSSTGRAKQAAALYRAIGEHAIGVDLLLLAGVDGGNVQLQLYSPSTDAFSKPVSATYDGDADDEAIPQIPALLGMLDGSSFPASATSPLAVPLDVGANGELASLLTQPREIRGPAPIPPTGPVAKKKNTALFLALGAAGVAVAGSGAVIGLQAARPEAPPPANNGTIVIGPY